MVSGGESDPEEPVPSERGEEELGGRRELGILLGISASPGGTLAAAEPSDAQRHRLQMLGAIGAFIGNASRETRQRSSRTRRRCGAPRPSSSKNYKLCSE